MRTRTSCILFESLVSARDFFLVLSELLNLAEPLADPEKSLKGGK